MPGPSQLDGTNLPGLLALIFVLAVVLFPLFLGRGQNKSSGEDEGEDGRGGPGGPRAAPDPPRGGGGIPLQDAQPARTRLRDHTRRLSTARGRRNRRPAPEPKHAPARPPSAD